jgi:SpoVK/Ycf46/Vps4 family AAA+-type ATPase
VPDRAAQEIDVLIRARYPLIYVVSWEERRVVTSLADLAARQEKTLHVWTETMGIQPGGAVVAPSGPDEQTLDPVAALDFVRTTRTPSVFVLKDFHYFISPGYAHSSAVVRKLRDLSQALRESYMTVVLLCPVLNLPPELEKDITVVDYDLPGLEELGALLDGVVRRVGGRPELQVDVPAAEREHLLKAALGMTLDEAENVLAKCLVQRRRFDIDLVVAEKEQIIRKSGVLEYYHWESGLDDVGGLALLKQWLDGRALAFSEKAREFGLPPPSGILLIGVQGCGKSLTAKAVASAWKLPLLRLDVGRLFGHFIGESEQNVRKAVKVAECVAPCILWVDEIEKGLAGVRSSAELDAGVTARVFGTMTTWMQEKTAPVFLVATANDISLLPPEFLRKGRFDEIFFVDLPGPEERKEILSIHLRRRKRDPAKFDLEALARQMDGFSGAEIEEAVVSGLFKAFQKGREVETADILEAAKESRPLSVTMAEDIQALREWARMRARPASAASSA